MEYNGKQFIDRLIEVSGNKTKVDIAKELMVDASTITRWTNNQPKTDNLLQIAATYNCSIDYLLGITNTTPGRGKNKKYLIDILNDLLICDMQGIKDCYLDFLADNSILPKGNITFSCVIDGVNYGELFDRYQKLKEAFTVVDDEEIKIAMINSLIDQYREVFYLATTNLPFK